MEISTETIGEILVLAPAGRLDGHGAGVLEEAVTHHITEAIRVILLDLKDVPYVSSAGIRVFLIARNRVKNRSGTVVLCNVSTFTKDVLVMAGMDKVFLIYQDREQAITAVRSTGGIKNASSLVQASRYQLEDATMEVKPAETGVSVLKVSGSLTRLLHAEITPDDVSCLRFSDWEYSLGLGSLAENKEQARQLLGEMITVHGSIVYLPTDGNNIPDYFVPVKDTGGVGIYSGFAVALQGPFHDYITIRSNSDEGITLGRIYKEIFSHAKQKHPDYAGIVALVLIGESGGIKGSGIIQSPISERAPSDKGSIMDPSNFPEWIEVMSEPKYAGETVVTFGVGVDLTHDLTSFDPDDLSALYYIHPANRGLQDMYLHTHGVVFTHTQLSDESDVGHDIKQLMKTGEFLDMRHLIDDSRFRTVRGAVAYISAIEPGNG